MSKLYKQCCSLTLIMLFSVTALFAQQTVTGIVTDANGAVAGVTVSVVGTTEGAQTDAKGTYTVQAANGAKLRFSAVGYLTKEVTVSGPQHNVALQEDATAIDEVVVTSFGIKREQRALGYAASTISAEEITQAGATNFASAMYGKAAGVKITTAPGGASSAVNVQIRGINSISYGSQPLYVVDGVIIRNDNQNGTQGSNNDGYWGDQRIRGNGILDINPADIENLTVLKGASATALYGSDAANGAIVITTKKGNRDRGLGIDFNYTGTIENVAFTPKFQNVYGPGYDRETNISVGATEEGWIPDSQSPSGYRPNFRAYSNFGPKMEGQDVIWWDGSIRPFVAYPDNYKDIFRGGHSSNANLSISNQTDNINYRLSYTRLDYNGIQRGSNLQKNTFNLNSNVKMHEKLNADIIVNYINTKTTNRPYLMNRVLGGYDGFFSRAEDVSAMLNKYQTSEGFKWVPYDRTERNPDEAFAYNMRPDLLNFFWSTLKNQNVEIENRFITSAALNWDIVGNLKFKGRLGNDLSVINIENREHSEYPVEFNENVSTGGFRVDKGVYNILYGDALVSYDDKLGSDFDFSVSAGFTGRQEMFRDQWSSTYQGLVSENWFSLNNSFSPLTTNASRKELLKYGFLGILNLSYKNLLYLEGTARQEYASSLPPKNNSYFYPSVNTSFIFTELWDNKPAFWDFGKLRASYGVVGNASPFYEANVLYTQKSLQSINGSLPALSISESYGNLELRPEMKHEAEFGLESRFFNGRLGVDASYYNNLIKDVILQLDVASSNGAARQIMNVGELRNYGFELALDGTPIDGNFRWNTRVNFAFNRSRLESLTEGLDELNFYNAEANGIKLVAQAGETLGNVYVQERMKDANGNFVINDDGYYVIDNSQYVKAGNILPKVVGGFSNSFSYKNFSLDVMTDFRFGGQMISTPLKYGIGTGQYESTMKYRDAANGGLTYEENGKMYDDGVLLEGVNQNTGQPNDKIISAGAYYNNSYQWGANALNGKDAAIFDNSYIKLRELSLGYRVPNHVTERMKISNLRINVVGRNLFYFWRTLENLDPEAPVGGMWYRQGIDEGSVAATRSFGLSLHASF
ncbi:SusC/RagA family TonB-linked outer membrane protein [Sphingobacterium arenae]|uniref:SusC/RagA family TonB-linked outer membrane protein n=1 Tax=Sphingobacterium arenae TaxID=1280598 RepID=A0ABR7Y0I3_9SPHI|nr:SusC/RagA family TonB-linked outer membrane protein [Sphingobacterium arenae]MBD1424820.1 SusC/RagA family TonB-linked outer membrane protein [Sphingobacterium arenae]